MLFSVRVFNNGKTPPRINLIFENKKAVEKTVLAATQNPVIPSCYTNTDHGNIMLTF